MQKRLLYRTCIIPVLTYGLRLWHFWGAKVQGVVKILAKVQRVATLWITGCFCTSPTGGVESLVGLLPMHLLLRRLTERSCLRAGTFTQSHPLRSLLGAGLEGSGPAHPLALADSGPLSAVTLQSPLADAASVARDVSRDEFEPFGPESRPGSRVLDLYGDHITVHRLPSSKEDDVAEYIRNLDAALRSAEGDVLDLGYLIF